MALNTGGFTLGVMPTAPTGVEKLGAFNVGQVLEASRAGAENVEAAFNTPFRVQQEIAKTKATQAASKIAQAKAARAAEAVDAELSGVKASVKAQELANRLKQETFDANANLEKIRTEQAATNLAASKEENPLKQKILQSQAEQLGVAAEAAQLNLEAAKQADLFAAQAGVKAGMARAGTKALAGFESGTRTITDATGRPLAVQTLTPTAEGASVSSIAIPQTQVVNTITENLKDSAGNDIIDPKTGLQMVQRYNVMSSGARVPVGSPIASGIAPGLNLKSKELKDESAAAAGLPTSAPNIVYNRDPETAKRILLSEDDSIRKAIEKDKAQLDKKLAVIAELNRFQELNAVSDTGPWWGKTPETFMGDEMQEMKSISDRLTPGMRQGLPGAASDRDIAMFKSATVGINKDKEVNDAIISAFKAQADRDADHIKFREDYKIRYGHLAGATSAWKSYVDANPIFDPNSKEPKMNPNIQTREQFFSSKAEAPKAQVPAVSVGSTLKTGPTKSPRVIQNGVTFVLQPDGVTYKPE